MLFVKNNNWVKNISFCFVPSRVVCYIIPKYISKSGADTTVTLHPTMFTRNSHNPTYVHPDEGFKQTSTISLGMLPMRCFHGQQDITNYLTLTI